MEHPHIIHIFEVFENKDKIVLIMEYASGGELYEYVSNQKVLNDSEARRLFRQIAAAIYYCHKNKICHRDLKLENILLDEKGNAKIGDFGLSNNFDDKNFLSTFCGSPLYASPEIVKGTPYYGPEVDCWSMGVILYTLVYGAMPFDGSNFKKLVKQISDSNYYEPKNKSEASPLIRRLLCVNPKKRATIIDIVSDSWVNQGFENTLVKVAADMANLASPASQMTSPEVQETPHAATTPKLVFASQPNRKKVKKSDSNDAVEATMEVTAASNHVEETVSLPSKSNGTFPSTTQSSPPPVFATQTSKDEVKDEVKVSFSGYENERSATMKSTSSAEETGVEEGLRSSTVSPSTTSKPTTDITKVKFGVRPVNRPSKKEGSDRSSERFAKSFNKFKSAIDNPSSPIPPTTPSLLVHDSSILGGILAVNHQPANEDNIEHKTEKNVSTLLPSSLPSEDQSPSSSMTVTPVQSEVIVEATPSPLTPSITSPNGTFGSKSTSSSAKEDLSSLLCKTTVSSSTDSNIKGVKPVAEVKPKKRNVPSPTETRQTIQDNTNDLQSENNGTPSSPSQTVSNTSKRDRDEKEVSCLKSSQDSNNINNNCISSTNGKPTLDVVGNIKGTVPQEVVSPTRHSLESQERPSRQVSLTGSEEGSLSEESPSSSHSRNLEGVERRSSSGTRRTIGRLSIPSFLEVTDKQVSPKVKKTPVPSYGSIEEAKKKLLERKDSVASEAGEKERVFPTIPVQEAKIDVERRASVPDPLPLTKGPNAIRLESEIMPGDVIIRKTARKVETRRQTEPLLNFNDKSVWDQHRFNNNNNLCNEQTKHQERMSHTESLREDEEENLVTVTSSVTTGSTTTTTARLIRQHGSLERASSSSSSQSSLAKEVLKKQLAKQAKLAEEKRLKMMKEAGSGVTPSHGQSSSAGSTLEQEPLSMSLDLTFSSKTSSQADGSTVSDDDDNYSCQGGVESSFEGITENPETESSCTPSSSLGSIPAPLKPAPITRSYKKVTFSKDGACITETGKVVFQTGPDGQVTKIEKRSKVTHYPSMDRSDSSEVCRSETTNSTSTITRGESLNELSKTSIPSSQSAVTASLLLPFESSSSGRLRKSESNSSSGSNDVFDDIFDTWSGEDSMGGVFSEMGIMMPRFKPIFPLTNLLMRRSNSRSSTRAKSPVARTRAESVERRGSLSSSTSGNNGSNSTSGTTVLESASGSSPSASSDAFDDFFSDPWPTDSLFNDMIGMGVTMPRFKSFKPSQFQSSLFQRRSNLPAPAPFEEESVRERIHRKSFYQRFNDDSGSLNPPSSPRHRSSSMARMTDSDFMPKFERNNSNDSQF